MRVMAKSHRWRWLGAGAAGVALIASAMASAAETQTLEGITVTGSRIKKADTTGDSPIQTISAQEIEASGLKSIGDILQRLSVSGSSLNTKFNSAGNFGFPPDGGGVGSGSSTLSLRNLGAKRTLVLVDGLRWVNESSASGISASVDLNTIPASIIDHIEILTDGASSLYGSDAIAGVVNIITKKKQSGLAADYYSGWNEIGGGPTSTADISFGHKGQKYEFFLDLNHFDQNAISSSEWGQSQFPVPGAGLSLASSAIPTTRTRFFPTDPTNTYGGLCPLTNVNGTEVARCTLAGNGTAPGGVPSFPDDFHQFTDADRFNFAPYNLLLTPSRRTSLFAQGDYKLNSSTKVYLRGIYEQRDSKNQAAPEPIFLGPGAGSGGLADTIGVDITNPYNPFGVTLDPNSNLVVIGRRPLEGGPRIFSQKVNTTAIATGLQGRLDFSDRTYFWDVNFSTGYTRARQSVAGTYNLAHIKQALGPVADCTGDCVPLNIFGGPGTITKQQLDYIEFNELDYSKQLLQLGTANISGPLFALPAGEVNFAAGYEYRRLSGSYNPDAVVVAGDGNGVPSLPSNGSYFVNELYAEFDVPLLAKLPWARSLDFSVATRHSEYSEFGGTTNTKYGLRWQPVHEVTVRANYAEGFRAPSIGELYASPARFDGDVRDPCSGLDPTSPLAANCTALGAPPGFEQTNTQIGIRTGGNPDLKPETSKTSTAGIVYSPSWANALWGSKKLDFELNFYHLRVDNAIQAPDAKTLLDRCVETLSDVFCSGISRGTTGDINGFQDFVQNLGVLKTQGYDFSVDWLGPKTQFGQPGVKWQTTYVEYFKSIASDSGLSEPRAVGVEVNDSSTPRWRSTLNLNWSLGNVSAGWTVRYISELKESCSEDVSSLPVCSNNTAAVNTLPEVFYDDVRFEWQLPIKQKVSIAGGINNVFDQGPPTCVSCSLNGYDASTYDLPGRFGYFDVSFKF